MLLSGEAGLPWCLWWDVQKPFDAHLENSPPGPFWASPAVTCVMDSAVTDAVALAYRLRFEHMRIVGPMETHWKRQRPLQRKKIPNVKQTVADITLHACHTACTLVDVEAQWLTPQKLLETAWNILLLGLSILLFSVLAYLSSEH